MTMQTNTPAATSNPAQAELAELKIYTDPKHVQPASDGKERIITARFRNPARSATVSVSAEAWTTMQAQVPASYASLLGAVLETAAKSILARRLESMSLWPATVSASLFTADAILAEASGANTEWLSREELTAAWEASATRKGFVTNPAYSASKAYRQAVDAYKELILKLAGKTSSYTELELDKMLVKIAEPDLESEFGAFVIKRIEALKNKPQRSSIDLDIL